MGTWQVLAQGILEETWLEVKINILSTHPHPLSQWAVYLKIINLICLEKKAPWQCQKLEVLLQRAVTPRAPLRALSSARSARQPHLLRLPVRLFSTLLVINRAADSVTEMETSTQYCAYFVITLIAGILLQNTSRCQFSHKNEWMLHLLAFTFTTVSFHQRSCSKFRSCCILKSLNI